MEQRQHHGIDWGSLVLGILFVLTALISFQNPAGNLIAIVMVFPYTTLFRSRFLLLLKGFSKFLYVIV